MARKAKVMNEEVVIESAEGSEVQSSAFRNDAKGLYAYAEFEAGGRRYGVGERFEPPHGWKRDAAMDELLHASKRKNKARVGVTFVYEGDIINPLAKKQDQERRIHTAVLPLEER